VVTNVSTTKIKNPFCDPNLFPRNISNGTQSKSVSKGVIIIDKYGNQKWSKGNDTDDTTIIDTGIITVINVFPIIIIIIIIVIITSKIKVSFPFTCCCSGDSMYSRNTNGGMNVLYFVTSR
jgi:hypothetical protein